MNERPSFGDASTTRGELRAVDFAIGCIARQEYWLAGYALETASRFPEVHASMLALFMARRSSCVPARVALYLRTLRRARAYERALAEPQTVTADDWAIHQVIELGHSSGTEPLIAVCLYSPYLRTHTRWRHARPLWTDAPASARPR